MDTFKGQDNDTFKKLSVENNCHVVIVPHNLTNKFQTLDLSVNKAAKSFIQSKYNDWFADQEFTRLLINAKDPTDVKMSSKLSDLKPIPARWIVDWYNHVIKEKKMIVRGFNSAGIRKLCRMQRISTKILRIHLDNSFFFLVKLLVFFQNISFKEKTFWYFFSAFKFNPNYLPFK